MSRYRDPDGAGYPDGPVGYTAAPGRREAAPGYPQGEDGDEAWAPRRARARTGGRGRRTRSARPRRRGGLAVFGHRPILSALAIIATVTVTGIALTAYAAYRNVYDSIHHVNVTNAMLGPRPPKLNGSLNVLMIGSDSRAGLHGRYGRGIYGSRSDTAMLLHISPTHNHVFVISFPRDSMVPIYACQSVKGFSGQQAQQGVERLNATFSAGGPPCLWKTLEQTTHIHIDHFMEVNFTSFKKIVNDLGGVNVCLPFAINDPASGLHLSKGPHLIGGSQALAFVRERHIGLGSDLQRIQRQQLFLASVAQKVKSSGILTNLPKLYTLVHDVASSLTTDTGLTGSGLYAIANSLRGLSTKSLRFISVPVVPYTGDPTAEVQWAQPSASHLFRAIARDNAIAQAAKNAAKAAKSAAPKASPTPTVSPSRVQLDVLNGTNTAGLAAKTASKLTASKFTVTGTGNANTTNYKITYIEYTSTAQLAEADTLASKVPGAQVKKVASLPGVPAGSIVLVLGSGFKGLAGSHGAKKSKSPVASLGSNYGGISGNTNICRDSGAFAGPDTPSMFGG